MEHALVWHYWGPLTTGASFSTSVAAAWRPVSSEWDLHGEDNWVFSPWTQRRSLTDWRVCGNFVHRHKSWVSLCCVLLGNSEQSWGVLDSQGFSFCSNPPLNIELSLLMYPIKGQWLEFLLFSLTDFYKPVNRLWTHTQPQFSIILVPKWTNLIRRRLCPDIGHDSINSTSLIDC